MKEAYKYHSASQYLHVWQYKNLINYNLTSLMKFNIKIRIFNHFFYMKDLYYYTNNNEVNFTNKFANNSQIKSYPYYLNFIYKDEITFNFTIKGYYRTHTHLVLCGPPDARTLVKSYENNKNNTMKRLRDIIGSTGLEQEIMDLAHDLVIPF